MEVTYIQPKQGKELRILMWRWHFNIRLAKEALALRRVFGYRPFCCITNYFGEHKNLIDTCFDKVFVLPVSVSEATQRMVEVLREVKPDIVVSHQEPNWVFLIMQEALNIAGLPRIPHFFEVHDMTTYRRPELSASEWEVQAERAGFETSDGIILIDEGVMRYARTKYNITAPHLVFRGFCSEAMIPEVALPKLPGLHIVYQGGLACRDLSLGDTWLYRYYLPQFRQMTDQGIHVHAYPGDCDVDKCWEYVEEEKINLLFHLHPQTDYLRLIQEMTQYHWGLASFNLDATAKRTHEFLQNTTPNKVWDYLAAGILSIVNNFDACARMVEDFGIGFECKDLSQVRRMIEEYPGRTEWFRHPRAMELMAEAQIWRMDHFFRSVIEGI